MPPVRIKGPQKRSGWPVRVGGHSSGGLGLAGRPVMLQTSLFLDFIRGRIVLSKS